MYLILLQCVNFWGVGQELPSQFTRFSYVMIELHVAISLDHIQVIDTFLSDAHDSLSIRPQSIEEIGQVNITHAELTKRKPEVIGYNTCTCTCNRRRKSLCITMITHCDL